MDSESRFKVGDIIYIKKEVLDYYRIIDKEYIIKDLKYFGGTYRNPLLSHYCVKYGGWEGGGHDFKISDVDIARTVAFYRNKKLSKLLDDE